MKNKLKAGDKKVFIAKNLKGVIGICLIAEYSTQMAVFEIINSPKSSDIGNCVIVNYKEIKW